MLLGAVSAVIRCGGEGEGNKKTENSKVLRFSFSFVRLLRGNLASLLDAGLLTGEVTQVEDTSATNNTDLVHLDLVDVRRVEGDK